MFDDNNTNNNHQNDQEDERMSSMSLFMDNFEGSVSSSISLLLTAGETYSCKMSQITGYGGATGESLWPPRPLHPLLAMAMVPLIVPTWLVLNRGFTVWWHLGILVYLVSGRSSDFLGRFLIFQGGAVNAGWYVAVLHDLVVNGRVCHLLYNNMPASMRVVMLSNGKLASGGIITHNAPAVATIVMSHLFDLMAHPLMLLVVWKMHATASKQRKRDGDDNNEKKKNGLFQNFVTWNVLLASYAFSRIYSMTHQYINTGSITGLFYYGYDVYHIDTLDSYTAAYVGEAILFLGLAGYKLYQQTLTSNRLRLKIRIGQRAKRQNRRRSLTKRLSSSSDTIGGDDALDRQKPALIHSDTGFSRADSTMTVYNED